MSTKEIKNQTKDTLDMNRKSYKDYLYEKLKNPEAASAYLDEAIKDDDIHVFLLALRDIAEAQGGMKNIAEKSSLNRESLYRTLSSKGNPRISSLKAVMDACGMQFSIQPKKRNGKFI